ncbi:hypothetical protein DTO013E5_8168 [Penicillium roqueforti]|uniref:Genomic scaffold, ProqFM164S02 n=1 Tax=Penicillium roqueforti (strain FM164) TaxID=1365484 RepID=W6Q1E4_PENRF|nr:uncharacterized protein LCP9604111_4729 [Penicillium roqueforti]CDM30150.1 unnamed protein product [Penicillium roqueforti FM164]KAF9249013.1 hypothetical protein LCP9604111_4729 [Penicillium roqueforti]KAI1831788.1 hypothetical protein CBS147337_7234 [Penicillium roqueforti]KAI2669814.1 hypothetical protein CBS147355_9663 [Penicillium roqueforti]KAI2673603.1 hypothetical protein LCP963914a_9049 [Penicillium roqueforti]
MSFTTFDPHLSAQLHNQILKQAWIGAGRDVASIPSRTWWEEFSPIPFDLASRLNPNLVRFLRSAKATIFDPDSNFHLFYYLVALHGKHELFAPESSLGSWGDRYVWLYPSTRTKSDEEVGIVFDQETELASFVPVWEDMIWSDRERWPWRPLQNILKAYLDMLDEGKITTYSDRRKESVDHFFGVFPWEIHQYTPMDVERAVSAFTRLLDAIEIRLPSTLIHSTYDCGIALPYSELVIKASFIETGSFIECFLSALPIRRLAFRYIAPGIRLQNPVEFTNQPLAERQIPGLHNTDQAIPLYPLLLFRGERENKSPLNRPWFPDGRAENIPSGLYIEPTDKNLNWQSGNQSRLLLPFSIGSNGFARGSNGIPFKNARFPGTERPDQLYQADLFSGYSGYLPWDSRSSYLHKVLESWAERVEMGDWQVDQDGVVGGIDKFKEADTGEHWREYFIPCGGFQSKMTKRLCGIKALPRPR